MDLNNVG